MPRVPAQPIATENSQDGAVGLRLPQKTKQAVLLAASSPFGKLKAMEASLKKSGMLNGLWGPL